MSDLTVLIFDFPNSAFGPDRTEALKPLAEDIAGNDPSGVRQLLATYQEGSLVTAGEAFEVEQRHSRAWLANRSSADFEARRQAVTERGRSQI